MFKKVIVGILAILLASCNNNLSKRASNDDQKVSNAKGSLRFIDFPNSQALINYNLWDDNEKLSAREFYLKYQDAFKLYNINLKFNDDNLIAQDGSVYNLNEIKNRLEKELTLTTNDHYKSKIISDSYYKHLHSVISAEPKIENSFIWFLLRYHVYLISDADLLMNKMSLYVDLKSFFESPSNKTKYYQFMHDINTHFNNKTSVHVKKNVAIITGPYGAGHSSTANAIEDSIKDKNEFNVVKINECTDFPDTLYLMTKSIIAGKEVGIHSCKIYNDIFVSEGNNYKGNLLLILNNKLFSYRPFNKFHDLYEKLKSENIDLIISTVHHIPEITSNSYMLKTPMRIVVTDYEFPFKQWFHLNHLHNSIKYWTPVNNYQGFFRSMVKHNIENNYWETSLLSACSNIIYQNMFNSSPNKTLEEISDELEVFEFLPFPSSTLFRTPTDQTDIMKNRQEINLSQNSDRKILTLALGGAPNAEEMIIVLKQMLQISNKIDSKVQVAIVSAGNNSLIQEVSEFLMSNSMRYFDDKTPDDETNTNVYADKITFKILPRLEYAVNMPKLYKSTDIIISKSGGASTAEVINTSTPFIRGFKLWSWEIENTKYLEKLGLAFSENLSVADLLKEDLSSYYSPVSNESLLNQINYHLAKSRPVVNVEKFDNNYLSNAIHNAIK